ncbi:hypothetical protein GWK47_038231 [Chionoecetes opilio]|uniref:Helix-turn-helix domain-containing protein n=1 Tax=Chionoecetes opilio TaxID=41210 RepID=A0A8J4YCS1_CHIOP|nr:hypothetical protein GWK47_038231 [Chionoecetes opilio]
MEEARGMASERRGELPTAPRSTAATLMIFSFELRTFKSCRTSDIVSSPNPSLISLMRKPPTDVSLSWMYSLVQTAGFKTTVFCKPTNKGLCLNGESECPKRYLHSTISAYVRRALSHCSTWKDAYQELERVTQVLINNGYSNSDMAHVTMRIIDIWYTNQDTTTPTTGEPIKLFYKSHMSTDYKTDEKSIKDIIHHNVHPTDPERPLALIIY